MTVSIETKILSFEENKTVISMLKAVYGEYDFDFSTHKDTLSFLAKEKEQIIGHAAIVKQDNYAELRGFTVDPAYRHKGIGTILEATRAQYLLNDLDTKIVHGEIATVNKASQIIKESIGFKATGTYLGSATPSELKQRTTQIPALWDLRENIKNSCPAFWIPQKYHNISEQTLKQFGITYLSINDNDSKLKDSTQYVKQAEVFGAIKFELTPGNDLEDTVEKLSQGNNKWIGISLDSSKETTPEAARILGKMGFFYAEMTPTGTLVLQKLLNQEIDTKIIPVIEAYRPIFNFVAEEYQKSL